MPRGEGVARQCRGLGASRKADTCDGAIPSFTAERPPIGFEGAC
jgi:hypothetical protein